MSEYPRKTVGHILQALRQLGIIESIAGSVTVGAGVIMLHDKPFALYKYFEGIEQPLFDFDDIGYHVHAHVREGEALESKFHLSLSVHRTPCLMVNGWDATLSLRKFLNTMITTDTTSPCFKIYQDSGAFFQSGNTEEKDSHKGYIFIEFAKPRGAQAFIDYLNANFTRDLNGNIFVRKV